MNDIKSHISKELQLIDNKIERIISADNKLKVELYNFINGNSKRIRSIITLLYLKCFSAEITDDILNLIVAAELIHNASLLHDDVIDNADIRRGSETISHKFSDKASILLGDYLMSVAVDILNSLHNDYISNKFMLCVRQMSESEIEQMLNYNKNILLEDYIHIAEGKTAGLFAAILSSAANLSNLNEVEAHKIGRIFGLMYQINNDTDNNSLASDCKNGVQTVVNILGIENANRLKDNYREEFRAKLFKFPDNIYRKNLEDLAGLL